MTGFLELPETLPSAPLMASLVAACDMLGEHGDLLPPALADTLFRSLCLAAALLMDTQANTVIAAEETIRKASTR